MARSTTRRPATSRSRANGRSATAPARSPGDALATLPRSAEAIRFATWRAAAGVSRDADPGTHTVVAARPGEDVVALTLGDSLAPDITLYLAPEDARDLIQAQTGGVQTARDASAAGADAVVRAPAQARWRALGEAPASRGLGELIFKAVALLKAGAQGAQWVAQRVDGQVDEGVYRLDGASLQPLKGSGRRVEVMAASEQPTLVLIHGTFVDTVSTFGAWWQLHGGLVDGLFKAYDGRVYALDHRTLGASPIDNALTLARACPPGARLHLVTHSRGGLVAEVLARVCGRDGDLDDALTLLKGAGYAAHRRALQALAEVVKTRRLRVERVVRVACPAHGTLLASGRLGAYLSVIAWLLSRAGGALGAVASLVVELAQAVARERTDPQALPGIEAMMPGRPLTRWLNQRDQAIPGQLRVVAGDLQGDSLTSWLKVLLADGFYQTDNDLVVNTNAMYGGSSRQGEASYLLERSGSTDHFHYFRNESTAQAIQQALLLEAPSGFQPIGPLSRSGQSASGERGLFREDTRIAEATQRALQADGHRPLALVLPGILGSNLRDDRGRDWLALLKLPGLMDRIAWRGAEDRHREDGPMADVYADLVAALERTHDVIGFGFDWRRPLQDEARRLAQTVRRELERRATSAQPVTVLAHSMGGLLLRCVQVVDAPLWDTWTARPGTRMVMLGTPNAGSWAPMTILTGDDSFGASLTAVAGFPFGEQRQRQRAAEMPGLMQLQAGLIDQGLDREATWRDMAARDLDAARRLHAWHMGLDEAWTTGPYVWAVPPQAVLDQAVALRRALDAQTEVLDRAAGCLAVVLGQAPETPDGTAWEPQGTLAYTTTAQGDGRVPWSSTMLPGVPAYKVATSHGDLPKATDAYELFRGLLQGTAVDPKWLFHPPATRGDAEGRARARPAHRPDALAPAARGVAVSADDLLRGFPGAAAAPSGATASRAQPPALSVQVVHGDVAVIEEPLLLGHTRSLALTGAERVVDLALGGVLGTSLRLHQYPEDPGQQAVFVNRHVDLANGARPRPSAAIVVGLGHEGDPTFASLRKEVRAGVLAYARHLWSQRTTRAPGEAREGFVLASLLMGSGSSVSVRDAAAALAWGVLDANQDLSERAAGERWPLVSELKVVDLYLDRASEAWRTLRDLGGELNDRLRLCAAIEELPSGRVRPPGDGYRGAAHDLVRITDVSAQQNPPCDAPAAGLAEVRLEYAMFTRRARSEVRGKSTQARLVDPMLVAAQGQTAWDGDLASSLYRLLLPQELQAQFSAGNALLLELDPACARYPWELLDDGQAAQPDRRAVEPLTLRRGGGLLRKLRLSEFRRRPSDALLGDRMVVVGVPQLSDERYPPLDAARDEAVAVAQALGVTPLLDAPPMAITTAVLSHPCRVLHLAGHGRYDPAGLASGMLMDHDTVLGPREFDSMDVVPELVFVNCCHLGHTEAVDPMPRHRFAANVAEQLMRNGVQCVIAAGWAVRDAPAAAFARSFYRALMLGQCFRDAVEQARRAAYEADPQSNTWAAYQCYGDPDWRLQTPADGVVDPNAQHVKPLPDVPSRSEMVLLVDELRQRGLRAAGAQRTELLNDLDRLVAAQAARFEACGQVLEAVGMAYQGLGHLPKALQFLDRACHAGDGRASFKAREQWLNMRARAISPQMPLGAALAEFDAVVEGLNHLIEIGATGERWNLLGSTWKRRVMRLDASQRGALPVGGRDPWRQALAAMDQAFERSLLADDTPRHYPLSQRLAAALRLHWLDGRRSVDSHGVDALLAAMTAAQRQALDFWDLVAEVETQLLTQVAQRVRRKTALDLLPVVQQFEDVHRRHGVPHDWASVHDNACFLLHDPARLAGWSDIEARAIKALLRQLKGYAAG